MEAKSSRSPRKRAGSLRDTTGNHRVFIKKRRESARLQEEKKTQNPLTPAGERWALFKVQTCLWQKWFKQEFRALNSLSSTCFKKDSPLELVLFFRQQQLKGCVTADSPTRPTHPTQTSYPPTLPHPNTTITPPASSSQDVLNPTDDFLHSVLRFIPGTFAWILERRQEKSEQHLDTLFSAAGFPPFRRIRHLNEQEIKSLVSLKLIGHIYLGVHVSTCPTRV